MRRAAAGVALVLGLVGCTGTGTGTGIDSPTVTADAGPVGLQAEVEPGPSALQQAPADPFEGAVGRHALRTSDGWAYEVAVGPASLMATDLPCDLADHSPGRASIVFGVVVANTLTDREAPWPEFVVGLPHDDVGLTRHYSLLAIDVSPTVPAPRRNCPPSSGPFVEVDAPIEPGGTRSAVVVVIEPADETFPHGLSMTLRHDGQTLTFPLTTASAR